MHIRITTRPNGTIRSENIKSPIHAEREITQNGKRADEAKALVAFSNTRAAPEPPKRFIDQDGDAWELIGTDRPETQTGEPTGETNLTYRYMDDRYEGHRNDRGKLDRFQTFHQAARWVAENQPYETVEAEADETYIYDTAVEEDGDQHCFGSVRDLAYDAIDA